MNYQFKILIKLNKLYESETIMTEKIKPDSIEK
jgi:hypothetical protein